MAYTYITLGSWERDVGRAEKQKRKNIFFFFFPSQTVSYPTVCSANTLVRIRTSCLCCLLRWGKGHTYIVNNAVLDWANAFHRKVFLCNSFSVMAIGTRTISFLCLLREASTVLRKSKLFPLEQLVSFQETHPTLLLLLLRHSATLCGILLCSVDFQ